MSFLLVDKSPQVNKDKEKVEVGIEDEEGAEEGMDRGNATLTSPVIVMLTCPAPPGPIPFPPSPLYK